MYRIERIRLYEEDGEGVYLQADTGTVWTFTGRLGDHIFGHDAPEWLAGNWSPDTRKFSGAGYDECDWEPRYGRTRGLTLVAVWTQEHGLGIVLGRPGRAAANYLGIPSRPNVEDGPGESLLDCALRDLDQLGPWPGNPQYAWANDVRQLRAEVLDAVAVSIHNPQTAAQAMELAEQAMSEGQYERVPDRPAVLPPYEEQTAGQGWWQWSPDDIWHYGPDIPFWPGPQTAREREWVHHASVIRARYIEPIDYRLRHPIVAVARAQRSPSGGGGLNSP